MKIITEVEFLQFYPIVLGCRLQAMERGDRLTVQEGYGDREGNLPPALAKDLIMRHIAKAVGVGYDTECDGGQGEETS